MTILREAGQVTQTGGRFRIGVITPGQGSSGTYPRETIEAAERDRVFAAGTHMYLDHATEAQTWERPEGSLRDLVGVLTEDARWDDEAGGLVAEARIYSHWKPILAEMKDDIGVSIRAAGEVKETTEGRIVTRLTEARSVDFVTKAGRGGRILEVLESARLREGVNDETRDLLRKAVRAAHPDAYVWVRDHDGQHVWFDIDTDTGEATFQQAYTQNGITISLDGEPAEVVATTVYVPARGDAETSQPPAGQETVNESQEGNTMGDITLTEAAHADLVAKASRVDEIDAQLAEANQKIATFEAEKAKADRHKHVAGLIEAAFDGIDDPAGVAALLTEKHTAADTDDDTIVAEAKDRAAKLTPTGGVTNLGETRPVEEAKKVTDDDIIAALEGA